VVHPTPAPGPRSDRHLAFALALLDAVPAGATENVVISPWSVSSALGVLAPGCDAPARAEVLAALAAGDGAADDLLVADLAADAAAVVAERGWSGEAALAVANTLWVDEGRTPVPTFVAALERWPGAGLRFAPIAADPGGARREINADVAATTRELIPEILPEGALTPDDRAVIVNALYLYAPWLAPFAVEQTADAPFHHPGGTSDVPTMHAVREAPYARAEAWRYVALPLDRGFEVEIVLFDEPDEPDGSDALPSVATLERLRGAAADHDVDLHLPRLRAGRATSLDGPLLALGVRRIFGLPPCVEGVVAEERLRIAGAYHAAVLRMDEAGFEGAAATALVARGVAYRRLPRAEMRVDRPFLLLVTHRVTGAVAFAARVRTP
jgi:serine protease inhibitor